MRGRAKTAFGTDARRALAVALALGLAFLGVFVAQACLPALAPIVDDASSEAGAPPFVGCGDGVIMTLDDGGDSGESCDPGPDASPGCTDCHITCENKDGPDPETGHCYFSPGSGHDPTYGDALVRCSSLGAHLVTFSSQSELATAQKIAGGESYWVGISRAANATNAYQASRVEEPGFPYPNAGVVTAEGPCPGCFGVGVDDSGAFPVNTGGMPTPDGTQCIASIGGSWFQVVCNGKMAPLRRTICEREPAGARIQSCGTGLCFNVPRTQGIKSYFVVVSSADPDTAAQSCNLLAGGRLVVFGSREEREQVAHELHLRGIEGFDNGVDQGVWIGLVTDGGVWTWEDGVVLEPDASAPGSRPPPWGNAEPATVGHARAYMLVNTNAYDSQLAFADDAGTPRLFICERPPQ